MFSVLPLYLDRPLWSNSVCFEDSNTNYTPVVAILVLSCFPVSTTLKYRVIQNDCRGIVYSCTDGSRNSQSFLL